MNIKVFIVVMVIVFIVCIFEGDLFIVGVGGFLKGKRLKVGKW